MAYISKKRFYLLSFHPLSDEYHPLPNNYLRSARRAQGGRGRTNIGCLRTACGGNAVARGCLERVKVLALAGVVGRVRAADCLDGGSHAGALRS